MDAIVNCGSGLAEAPLRSQNLTPKRSSFSPTIDSQSSIGNDHSFNFIFYFLSFI